MTTLVRIGLDPTDRRLIRTLGDPVALHRCVMSAYDQIGAPDARAQLGILWRLDTDDHRFPVLLVQSHHGGRWDHLPESWVRRVDTKDLDPIFTSITSGQTLRFRLRANATRKIDTKSDVGGARRNGQRVPLRSTDRALAWLRRHADAGGFELVEGSGGPLVEVRLEAAATGRRKGGSVTVEPVHFEGLLRVVDASLFASAVRSGVGPGKAFGCGLLSMAAPSV